ncbi:MAG: efflux RND transporter periplasmic adaptor subunit [Alphaproteobacteria bacterium]|nr:efflux RND transporter periplasmic adaptor subunit [Alphaproteobacteria bacterium]
MNRRIIIAAILIGIVCAGLVGWNFARSLFGGGHGLQLPPTAVEAMTVQPAPWLPSVDAVGTARAARGTDVAVQIAGVVKEIKFKPNDHVKAGQLLVQIDDAVERAELLSAQANVRLYAAQLARAAKLKARGFVSQSTYDDTRAQLEVARGAQARAQALIDQKGIKAPFDGIVGIARVDAGQYLTVGTVVVTLQDLDRMKVDFTVPEQTAASLSMNQPVRFGDESAQRKFNGRIIGIDPKIDPSSRLVAVQAEVSDAQGRVRPGSFLRVRVDMPAEANVIALPQTAIIPSLYGDYVFVVGPPKAQPKTEDAKGGAVAANESAPGLVAEQRFVTTGRRDGERVEIVRGVKSGERVVTSGQNRLQDGAAVALAEAPNEKAAAAPGTPRQTP